MGTTSVAQIALDLEVNQKQFNKQMSGITSLAKKVGATLAAAFATKKIVSFGKECLELGSDLSEVQNVVDVTFSNMTSQVEEFAKSAEQSFGLSETMAKQYTGTFGSMAKAFGFTEQEAYDMGSTLTGLAGDVASFYNISQDEAYTKLKSVFTGETETLKDLGVVMTQSALDSYAMANGFEKTTSAMSEAEKVALRYQFVQDKLASAQGDFARTSGSWANQVRILKLQFDSLKATIGQGLINLFTPVIKVINTLLGKLATLANGFKSFTELITGNKSSGSSGTTDAGLADAADTYSDATDGASDYADATDQVTSATKKAKKAAESYLSPIDTIHRITSDDEDDTADSSDSTGTTGSTGNSTDSSGTVDSVDYGSLAQGETALDKISGTFDKVIKKAKELAGLFKQGFFDGLGDFNTKVEGITADIQSIGANLKGIFTSPEVTGAVANWTATVSYSLGQITGSVGSIGLTIGSNLIGGVENYISENKDRIQGHIITVLNVSSQIMELRGEFAEAFAYALSPLGDETAQEITGDIIGIFSEIWMFISETALKIVRDVENIILTPFIENKEKLKKAVEETLKAVEPFTDGVLDAVQKIRDTFNDVYDKHLKPLFDSIEEGLSKIFGIIMDGYNSYVAPVLQILGQKFQELMNGPFGETMDKVGNLLGKIIDILKELWENVLVPLLSWIASKIMPVIATVIGALGGGFLATIQTVITIIGGIADVLSDIIDFIGIFTGEWTESWNGIKETVGGAWNSVKGFVSSGVSKIKGSISSGLSTIKQNVSSKWQSIKETTSSTWKTISSGLTEKWDALKTGASTKFSEIKSIVSDAWSKTKSSSQEKWSSIKQKLAATWTDLHGSSKSKFYGIKSIVSDTWEKIKNSTANIWKGIKDAVKSPINAIIGFINRMISGLASGVNAIADMFNSLSIDIPDWVPGYGGGTLGFNLPHWDPPQIPYLASGAVIPPNDPFTAVLGDQKSGTNIEAPESLIRRIVREETRSSSQNQGGSSTYVIPVNISGRKLLEVVIDEAYLKQTRSGKNVFKLQTT